MTNRRLDTYQSIGSVFNFLQRVARSFIRNRVLLLSGAVAYYTLLSIVPLSILGLIVLTNFIEEKQLILTLSMYLEMMIPGYAATLTEQVQGFLQNRKVVGIIGFVSMLFFSSTAFSMLEDAMATIFHRAGNQRRTFFISAIIPYLYIVALGAAIVLVSFIVGGIETLENSNLSFHGWSLNLGGATGTALYLLGLVGEVLMFTSIYLVMPKVRIRFRYALTGGITAAFLWEITRRLLIWYYSVAKMVNIIYGSIAMTVVALVSIEVVAIILLLGAQVIAELEHHQDNSSQEQL